MSEICRHYNRLSYRRICWGKKKRFPWENWFVCFKLKIQLWIYRVLLKFRQHTHIDYQWVNGLCCWINRLPWWLSHLVSIKDPDTCYVKQKGQQQIFYCYCPPIISVQMITDAGHSTTLHPSVCYLHMLIQYHCPDFDNIFIFCIMSPTEKAINIFCDRNRWD